MRRRGKKIGGGARARIETGFERVDETGIDRQKGRSLVQVVVVVRFLVTWVLFIPAVGVIQVLLLLLSLNQEATGGIGRLILVLNSATSLKANSPFLLDA